MTLCPGLNFVRDSSNSNLVIVVFLRLIVFTLRKARVPSPASLHARASTLVSHRAYLHASGNHPGCWKIRKERREKHDGKRNASLFLKC